MKNSLTELNIEEINYIYGGGICHVVRLFTALAGGALGAIGGAFLSQTIANANKNPTPSLQHSSSSLSRSLTSSTTVLFGFTSGILLGYNLFSCDSCDSGNNDLQKT